MTPLLAVHGIVLGWSRSFLCPRSNKEQVRSWIADKNVRRRALPVCATTAINAIGTSFFAGRCSPGLNRFAFKRPHPLQVTLPRSCGWNQALLPYRLVQRRSPNCIYFSLESVMRSFLSTWPKTSFAGSSPHSAAANEFLFILRRTLRRQLESFQTQPGSYFCALSPGSPADRCGLVSLRTDKTKTL
jgi:hypothetical protein